jgi:lysophospholipase L1-like esterase
MFQANRKSAPVLSSSTLVWLDSVGTENEHPHTKLTKKIEASQQDLNTLAKEWVRHKDTITVETWREHLDYLVVEQRRIDKLIEKRNRLVLG